MTHDTWAAAVVISTKDRRLDLHRAIRSVLRQTVPLQVIVLDDGSSDGTAAMVAREFPDVELHRSARSRGYIVQRNRGAAMARAPIIVSIDDDAELTSRYTVEQTLAEFDHQRVGAVAIPYINVRQGGDVLQRAPDREHVWAGYYFVGTAHALRRDVFLALGGYREPLFHFSEERDFCVRLLDVGYLVRLGNADPLRHYESPRRDVRRFSVLNRRNDVLFAWHNVPMPQVLAHAAGTTLSGVAAGVRCRSVGSSVRGLLAGYRMLPAALRERRPVSRSSYRLFRRLKARRAIRFDEIPTTLAPVPLANGSDDCRATLLARTGVVGACFTRADVTYGRSVGDEL